MIKIMLFIGLLSLLSVWISPFIQTILQAKGTFIYFFTSYGIPIGQMGFSAIFTLIAFSMIFAFLRFTIN